MSDKHIIEILDNAAFDALKADELAVISEHNAGCGECRGAFETARIASAILKFEAEEQVAEPTPFFQTKVMAALREQRAQTRSIWDFWRMWQAAGSMVAAMVLVVMGLMLAVVMAPQGRNEIMAIADESETLVFEQEITLRDMNGEQVFPVIFER